MTMTECRGCGAELTEKQVSAIKMLARCGSHGVSGYCVKCYDALPAGKMDPAGKRTRPRAKKTRGGFEGHD
jgi:hypothetical protein